MSKTFHLKCDKDVSTGVKRYSGPSRYVGQCSGCNKQYAVGDAITNYVTPPVMPAAYTGRGSSSIVVDAPNIDWDEANRFDYWLRRNAGPLRELVSQIKEQDPRKHHLRGITIATDIYHDSFAAQVKLSLAL